MITFEVDAVEPAGSPLPALKLGELVQGASWFAPHADTPVVDPRGVHPLLAAVHRAFAEHRPLVLSPDAVWLTLAQGVAQHVRLHAEALRPRLVRHEGRKALEVRTLQLPEDGAGVSAMLSGFRAALSGSVGPGLARLLSCDFSTSTDVERMAADVVLLDALSPYHDYLLACVCG